MTKLQLIPELTETRILKSKTMLGDYTLRNILDYTFLYLLTLQILRQEPEFADFVQEYAEDTLRFAEKFDYYKQHANDLYQFLHILVGYHNDSVLDELKPSDDKQLLLRKMSPDEGKIKEFMKRLKYDRDYNETWENRFFLRLQQQLLITDSNLRAIRRLVRDWDKKDFKQKSYAITRLLLELRIKARNSDVRQQLEKLANTFKFDLSEGLNWAVDDNLDKAGKWVQKRANKNGYSVVNVDIKKLLERTNVGQKLSTDVETGGTNQIGARIPKAKEHWKQGGFMDPSEINVTENGVVHFTDGRHRLVAALQMGETTAPVIIPNGEVQYLKDYGLLAEKADHIIEAYGETWDQGPYNEIAELVPVKWLEQFKGNELRLDHGGKVNIGYNPKVDDWEYSNKLEDLANSMQERGIQEPLILFVSQQDQKAWLGEGNHRLAAARLAGIKEVPVRVIVYKKSTNPNAKDVSRITKLPKEGYVPSDMSPSKALKIYEGTNIQETKLEKFGIKNAGIPRKWLPQIEQKDVDKFLKHLEDEGISHRKIVKHPKDLIPTQDEIDPKKTKGKDKKQRPVIISFDNYILDGHHRWFKKLRNKEEEIHCIQVSVGMQKLLDIARNFEDAEYKKLKEARDFDFVLNPTLKDLNRLTNISRYNAVRILVSDRKEFAMAIADNLTHSEMLRELDGPHVDAMEAARYRFLIVKIGDKFIVGADSYTPKELEQEFNEFRKTEYYHRLFRNSKVIVSPQATEQYWDKFHAGRSYKDVFENLVNESKIIELDEGEHVIVNPTKQQLKVLVNKWKEIRGLVDRENNCYIWPAYQRIHYQVGFDLYQIKYPEEKFPYNVNMDDDIMAAVDVEFKERFYFALKQNAFGTANEWGSLSTDETVRTTNYVYANQKGRRSTNYTPLFKLLKQDLNQNITESKILDASIKYGKQLKIYKNPTAMELKHLVHNKRELRGILDYEDNLYVWDAFDSTHDTIADWLLINNFIEGDENYKMQGWPIKDAIVLATENAIDNLKAASEWRWDMDLYGDIWYGSWGKDLDLPKKQQAIGQSKILQKLLKAKNVNEAKRIDVEGERNDPLGYNGLSFKTTIWINPTSSELKSLLYNKVRLRGLLTRDDDIYVWPAPDVIHYSVSQYLQQNGFLKQKEVDRFEIMVTGPNEKPSYYSYDGAHNPRIDRFMKKYNMSESEVLDVKTLTPAELADKHNVPETKIRRELKKGIKVELEHTTDRKLAREIALDHLKEMPDYYTQLIRMEKGECEPEDVSEAKRLEASGRYEDAGYKTTLYKNPTISELSKLLDNLKELRGLSVKTEWNKNDIYIWKARDAIHAFIADYLLNTDLSIDNIDQIQDEFILYRPLGGEPKVRVANIGDLNPKIEQFIDYEIGKKAGKVNEAKVIKVDDKIAHIRVKTTLYKNPTWDEFKQLAKKKSFWRGILMSNNDIIIWPSEEAIHSSIENYLQINFGGSIEDYFYLDYTDNYHLHYDSYYDENNRRIKDFIKKNIKSNQSKDSMENVNEERLEMPQVYHYSKGWIPAGHVYLNPSLNEFYTLLTKHKDTGLRGQTTEAGDILVWDASMYPHSAVNSQIKAWGLGRADVYSFVVGLSNSDILQSNTWGAKLKEYAHGLWFADGSAGAKHRPEKLNKYLNFATKKLQGTVREAGVGKIVKGVNTTQDVGTDELKKQAKKFGFDVDKNGYPQKKLTESKTIRLTNIAGKDAEDRLDYGFTANLNEAMGIIEAWWLTPEGKLFPSDKGHAEDMLEYAKENDTELYNEMEDYWIRSGRHANNPREPIWISAQRDEFPYKGLALDREYVRLMRHGQELDINFKKLNKTTRKELIKLIVNKYPELPLYVINDKKFYTDLDAKRFIRQSKQENVNEAKIIKVDVSDRGEPHIQKVLVYQNPSAKEVKKLLEKFIELRFDINQWTGDVYFWDAFTFTHAEMQEELDYLPPPRLSNAGFLIGIDVEGIHIYSDGISTYRADEVLSTLRQRFPMLDRIFKNIDFSYSLNHSPQVRGDA